VCSVDNLKRPMIEDDMCSATCYLYVTRDAVRQDAISPRGHLVMTRTTLCNFV